MVKKKKLFMPIIAGLILLLILSVYSLTTFFIDSSLVDNGKKARFAKSYYAEDGGTIVYRGLGYQIISWKKMSVPPGYNWEGVEKHYLFGMIDIGDGPTIELQKVPEPNYSPE